MGNCLSFSFNKRMTVEDTSMLPIESEVQRQQLLNFYISNLWESNFSSPIDNELKKGGKLILDVGCGSGSWLLEVARMYPNNQYFGVDIAPLFPTNGLPENVHFVMGNILNGLPFLCETFDFVHQRFLVRNFNTRNWQMAIKELTRVAKPGAQIELMEMDLITYNQGPTTKKLFEAFLAAMHSRGISPTIKAILKRTLISNKSLENIDMNSMNGLLRQWDGIEFFENGIEIFKLMKRINSEFMSVPSSEYDEMLETYHREIFENETYVKTYRFMAQKKNTKRIKNPKSSNFLQKHKSHRRSTQSIQSFFL
ncbi:S-adenosyl-L-methionine-dependent methyltransferase [Glomus cerebriforme]|uniref:S-adenosyl-L-methionine-dependent methyltransferase n=1 Tax=Glomus cerebriforme TaxID=658196 RepID=A0A397T3A5_9GLOM|nr:S-adenosyl-L-methionine-dependent methyltransferase [Glomus cerebriforme]